MSQSTLSRRRLLNLSLQSGVLLASMPLLSGGARFARASENHDHSANLFVRIDSQGITTITCHRSEMGQQIRTSIAQIIADEMEADWNRIRIEQANGDPKYGDQNTDGSRSVRRNMQRLREAGAELRELLRHTAATQWQVPAEECEAILHRVTHEKSQRSADYGELVALIDDAAIEAQKRAPKSPLKTREEWRYIGKAKASVDMDAVLGGTTQFGMDVQLDGMLVAAIARPPVVFGRVKSVDDSAAKKHPGVRGVVQLDSPQAPPLFKPLGGVAVLADNTWAAFQARDKLNIEWENGGDAKENASYNSASYREQLRNTVTKSGEILRQQGDVKKALSQANQTIKAEYSVPHLVHAMMEPLAATAKVSGNSAEIWACTQHPQAARDAVADALGLKPEQVTIHVTLLGGGFGRKSKQDFVVEAALLAKASGRPVKVAWSREDEVQHAYYHSCSAQYLEAGLNSKGETTSWLHRTAFPTIGSTFTAGADSPMGMELDMGLHDIPFDIPNLQLEKGKAQAHLRIGWLRSVINIHHAFAIGSFAHELAVAAKQDPKDYLLSLIGPDRHIDLSESGVEYANYGDPIEDYPIDTARLRHVIERAANISAWDKKRKAGRALGIAAHRSFLSYVATVVEVEVDSEGRWSIPEVFVVIDAGTVVNTEHVKAQCEGGSIFGLSCAMGEITAENGEIQQSNFHDFRIARLNEAPRNIHVEIVESDALPAGVGEPPTPPFIPAFCNALYEASGQRIRDLPVPDRLKIKKTA